MDWYKVQPVLEKKEEKEEKEEKKEKKEKKEEKEKHISGCMRMVVLKIMR